MKIIDLQQGSPEWLAFRRKHLTATDASIIMGWNPWRTKLSLWEEKVLGWELQLGQTSLEKMKAGTEMEPIAREVYETLVGESFTPMVVESTEHPFLSASLDGMNESMNGAVEIKCGASSHKSAMEELIPAYYLCQLAHQMLVTGLDFIDYFSYYKGEGILLTVNRDDELCKELLEKEIEFWHHIQTGTPPGD